MKTKSGLHPYDVGKFFVLRGCGKQWPLRDVAQVSGWTVTRMLANVGVETVIGAVPFLGDLFDIVFKANRRNLALLGDTLDHDAPPRDPTGVLRLASVLIVAVVLLMLAATMALTVAVYRMIFG